MDTYFILWVMAVLAGAINAIAGGGTLLTFPALYMALGQNAAAAVWANGTSTTALVPGAMAAFWGYRREAEHLRPWLIRLTPPSLLGGAVGTLLVVYLPAELFQTLVPWLILGATLLLALQPRIVRWVGVGKPHHASPATIAAVVVFQFVVSIYGGYFGAGVGILMLSTLAMMGMTNIHEMNALKSFLGGSINSISAILWLVNRQVHIPYALTMAVGAIVGGYFGARVARKLDPNRVRQSVVAIGLVLAAIYFYREFY